MLIPVVTLVIYFGSDSWDAPLSLKEMYSNVDDAILAHTGLPCEPDCSKGNVG